MFSDQSNEEKDNSSKVNCNPKVTVNKSMPDLSNDPFIIRKGEMCTKMLEKYGVPEALLKK